MRGHSDIVTFLLDAGVDVNIIGDRHNRVITPDSTPDQPEVPYHHLSRPT